MVQSHNRRMALSWYLASIAVADTVELSIGEFSTHSREINF